jgi:hypothetical protein
LHRRGPVDQTHVTGSTTVFRLTTQKGDVYFKAVTPAYNFEIRLTEFLTHNWPSIAPNLLACDADKGWLLMQDGGSRLREVLQAAPDLERWESVLGLYAQLQQQSMPYVAQLLDLEVPDRRLEVLLDAYDQFLTQPERLVCDELTEVEVDRLLESRSMIEDCVISLESLGIGSSLDHGDFHDGNIFVHQSGYVFFDWGDAGLTHPFFSLRTVFVSLENSLGFEEDDPIFNRLSEHYLHQWTAWGSLPALQRAYLISKPLASLNTAVRWQAAIDDLYEEDRPAFHSYVPSLLSEVLIYLDDLM